VTAVLRMEWLRLRSVRSTYWLLFVAALATMAVGVTALAVYRTHLPRPGAVQMVNDALSGSPVPRAGLGDPGVLRTIVFSGAYLTLIGLLGVGIGALVRHTGAAVGILFGLLFVPPFVLAILGSAGFQIAKFTPLIILANSVGVVTPTRGCLSAWAGLGVMVVYAAVALGLGGWLLTRRDA